jgi:hypothetical protein
LADFTVELQDELAGANDRLRNMPQNCTNVDSKGPLYQFEVVTRERIAALNVQLPVVEESAAQAKHDVHDMAKQVKWDDARIAEEETELRRLRSR